jgi:GDPmannose 4,6-dehydratase
LITGIRGQDGAYLAQLLVGKGYEVVGLTSTAGPASGGWRLQELGLTGRVELIPASVLDGQALQRVMARVRPHEVYHLAAQSSVRQSFEQPVETIEVGALGTVRMLEAVRALGAQARFYQASSSEMFGRGASAPQNESTPLKPSSPYAVAKACAHEITRAYREAYGVFACSGILFNHESPLRDPKFVTRKITMAAAAIAAGRQTEIKLGNLSAHRDFGYAPEYVEAMWRMLQQDEPDDYVIATGEAHSIREFAERAFAIAGLDLDAHLVADRSLLRPADQDLVIGDASRARAKLGWQAHTSFDDLVQLLVEAETARLAADRT